jgi:alpha-mannosidase
VEASLIASLFSSATIMGGETAPRIQSSYPQLSSGPVGQQIESIYTDRLRQFTSGGQYEKHNLLS